MYSNNEVLTRAEIEKMLRDIEDLYAGTYRKKTHKDYPYLVRFTFVCFDVESREPNYLDDCCGHDEVFTTLKSARKYFNKIKTVELDKAKRGDAVYVELIRIKNFDEGEWTYDELEVIDSK